MLEFWIFGIWDFWSLVFLEFWIVGILDFGMFGFFGSVDTLAPRSAFPRVVGGVSTYANNFSYNYIMAVDTVVITTITNIIVVF